VAHASYLSAVGFVESAAVKMGQAGAVVNAEPWTLRKIRERISQREANAAGGVLTPLELDIKAAVDEVNTAYADPEAAAVRRASSRGGGELLGKGGGVVIADGAIPLLVSFSDVAAAAGRSRQLSDPLWDRAWLEAYKVSSPAERVRLSEGLIRGAGAFALAIPMARPFVFTELVFKRMLQCYLAQDGLPTPWKHHCVKGSVRTLGPDSINHIQVCSITGRNLASHNEVARVVAHMVQQCGVSDVIAITESPVTDDKGVTFNTDVRFVNKDTGDEVVIEVRTCAMGGSSAVFDSARPDYDQVERLMEAAMRDKERNPVMDRLVRGGGGDKKTRYVPFILTTGGAFHSKAQKFLNEVYEIAKKGKKIDMAIGQAGIESTWNTRHASMYWDMRLSVACAATDAQAQNRIIYRDRTLNMDSNSRWQGMDPNAAPYETAVALRASPGVRQASEVWSGALRGRSAGSRGNAGGNSRGSSFGRAVYGRGAARSPQTAGS